MKGPIDMPQPKESAEFAFEQKNPLFRKELKRNIERGFPVNLARLAARSSMRKTMSRGKEG